jgi:putative membrane protein
VSDFLVRLVINALALIAAVRLVPQVRFDDGGDAWKLLAVAAIFGVINSYLRPIVKALSLPLNLVSLGLVGFVINTGLLLLLAFVSDQLDLGFTIARWPEGPFRLEVLVYAFIASVVISLVSAALGLARRILPGV